MQSLPLALCLFLLQPEYAISQEIVTTDASSPVSDSVKPPETKGYKEITVYGDGYLAVGSDGRIDRIEPTGAVTSMRKITTADLNQVFCVDNTIVVVGEHGTILVSNDGQVFHKSETKTDLNIRDIVIFQGLLIAAVDRGVLLVSENGGEAWRQISIPLYGEILSMSRNEICCMGVTNKGEIIKSTNGFDWKIFDYNNVYKGYYMSCSFRKILIAGGRIAVTGIHEDGTPVVLLSSLGNVWTERSLNYTDDQGMVHLTASLPNDICYDSIGDQYLLACKNGEILCLPSCSHCNKLFTISEKDLYGISCSADDLRVVGNDYELKSIKLR